MPEALWFTEDEEACRLLAADPFALLVGFALDQQVTVQQAFLGPLRLRQRLGTLDPKKVAKADLEPLFPRKPAPCGRSSGRSPRSTASRALWRRASTTWPRRSSRTTGATRRAFGPRRR